MDTVDDFFEQLNRTQRVEPHIPEPLSLREEKRRLMNFLRMIEESVMDEFDKIDDREENKNGKSFDR